MDRFQEAVDALNHHGQFGLFRRVLEQRILVHVLMAGDAADLDPLQFRVRDLSDLLVTVDAEPLAVHTVQKFAPVDE